MMVDLNEEILKSIYLEVSFNSSEEDKHYFCGEDKVTDREALGELVEVEVVDNRIKAGEVDLV
jgi:hypothetical protein